MLQESCRLMLCNSTLYSYLVREKIVSLLQHVAAIHLVASCGLALVLLANNPGIPGFPRKWNSARHVIDSIPADRKRYKIWDYGWQLERSPGNFLGNFGAGTEFDAWSIKFS